MSIEYCKISLIKLTGKQSKAGYQNSALKVLFGSTKVNPCLPFSRSEFFQSGKQYAQGMSISGVQQKLSLKVNEKLMQCFNLPSEDKYSKTYEEAGKLILEVTNGKQAAALDFVRRVILAYVTGNDDLHLKNISVQRLPDSTSHHYDKLTPNYDCLFCEAFRADNPGMGLLALGLLHDREAGDEHFTDTYQH
jgi:hypothetical protein